MRPHLEIIMQYYQRLRDTREDNDKRQEDIAAVLRITRPQYHLYESGKRELPMHHFITLARYYNISLDYLAGLTNTPRTIEGKPYTIEKRITITRSFNGNTGDIKFNS